LSVDDALPEDAHPHLEGNQWIGQLESTQSRAVEVEAQLASAQSEHAEATDELTASLAKTAGVADKLARPTAEQ
jgi:hypothetical protein